MHGGSTSTAWIGQAPTRMQSAAVFAAGVNGVLVVGLQPTLLGALAREHRLTAAQLGHAATAELLTMGLAAALAGALLKPERLRAIGLGCGVLLALLDLLTTRISGEAITLVRGIAGAPSGIMIWLAIALIARAPRPERWSGAYLTLQTGAQFTLAFVLATFVIPRLGSAGGWTVLAGTSLLAGAAALAAPARLAPLAHADAPGGLPSVRGLIALGACVLFVASVSGVWVYSAPLSHQAGHAPWVVGQGVALSLGCQMAGGFTATLVAGRLRWFPTLLVCAALDFALLSVLGSLPGPAVYLLVCGVFGFAWLFLLPFMVPMTIEADPTRRAAVLLGGAQLLGAALGPFVASMLVSDTDVRGAIAFGLASLVTATALIAGVHLKPARAAVAAG